MGIVTDYLRKTIARQIEEHESHIVLWFDPERHYTAFAQSLSLPGVTVARYEGSFFALRHAIDDLLKGDDPPRLLVYVPLAEEDTHDALSELAATAAILKPGQGSTQRNTRLSVVARRALRPVLGDEKADEVARQVEADRLSLADLDQLGSVDGGSAVIKTIFGTTDPQDVALAFLDTERHDEKIIARKAIDELAQLFGRAFGVTWPGNLECSGLRIRLARHLLTVEFLASLTGTPPPELATIRLPTDPEVLEACTALVRAWRLRRDLQSSYVTHAKRVEQELRLDSISFTLAELRNSETFAITEQALQSVVEQALIGQPAEETLDLAQTRITGFWSERCPAIQARWALTHTAGLLLREAARIERELKVTPADPVVLLRAYAEGEQPWCLLDTYQRNLERRWHTFELSDQPASQTLENLVTRARQRYMEVGDLLACTFTRALARSKGALPGLSRQRDTFVSCVRPALAKGKTAYVLVDALRFEMARELQHGLNNEYQSQLTVAVGAVPTITEIGMASLMPGAEGDAHIVPAGEGKVGLQIGNVLLKDRQSRLNWLRKQVNEPLVIAELEEMLPKPSPALDSKLQQARLIVVTSQEIDELAERDNIRLARKVMDDVLVDLARLVRKLREYGCETIIIAADHGYLFGDELDSSMKIDPPGGKTIDLHRRVWIGRGGADSDAYLRFSLASFGLGDDLDIAVPRGLGAFKVSGGARAYFHGGLAPQELAIPVLTLQPAPTGRLTPPDAIQWSLVPGTKKIATRFFSVQITARSNGLFEFHPPRVRIEVRSKGANIAEPVSATYGLVEGTQEIELRTQTNDPKSVEPNTVTMMISGEAGKTATVHLLDAETGRELAKIEKIDITLLAL
ncbi:PglZ domain-containing protein [Chloroflexus sp.]|uniref:PglZ domain-containing protein n=1 Tax=Chloroflexus sp. TaxID=1904827 RepID=UPI00298EEE9E|nr:PglZ domain-containing protein [Chloroflexus sp.]MDW8403769.1 PglZ domain-containing protein [Chloroflexus sp.]